MTVQIPGIKFCGLTRPVDIEVACALQVEYVGLVFAEGSPRRISCRQAAELAEVARSQTHRPQLVALVRDLSSAEVAGIIEAIQPDLLQFHGSEDEVFCRHFGLPYWKALGLAGVTDIDSLVERSHPSAQALLLDAHAPGAPGGSGNALDWLNWPRTDRRLVLAGGLDPSNIAAAAALTRPFAVDVSSGIESAPGLKDPGRMAAFVAAVRADEPGRPFA